MAFESQIEQYKGLPFSKRLMVMAFVGVLLPFYILYSEYDVVMQDITMATEQRNLAEQKLTAAKAKQAQLPQKLKELEAARAELAMKSSAVSAVFDMDEILRKTAGSAKDNGINIESFKPGIASEEGVKVRYYKQEIDISVSGKFVDVTRFLDSLLNLGPLIYLIGINYQQIMLGSAVGQPAAVSIDRADLARERTAVRVSAKMLVFKKVTVN